MNRLWIGRKWTYSLMVEAVRYSLFTKTYGEKAHNMKHTFFKWFVPWGALATGHLVAILMFCGINSIYTPSLATTLGSLAMIPFSAVIYAALGPLAIVGMVLFMFRVQGGTATAICSLLIGSPLMYCAVIWGLRRWWRATGPLARCVGWIMLTCYSAVATYCLLYISIAIT